MIVNFKCGKCKANYNFEVGKPDIDKKYKLVFEKNPICPKCGAVGKELLSELGQSQMTAWHLGDMTI